MSTKPNVVTVSLHRSYNSNFKGDNGQYTLDVDAALKAGVLTRKQKPIKITDLRDGDIFKIRLSQSLSPDPARAWSNDIWLMVDRNHIGNGQVALINRPHYNNWFGQPTATNNSMDFCVLQDDGTWKETIDI